MRLENGEWGMKKEEERREKGWGEGWGGRISIWSGMLKD
jgi:hypothetical protein